MQLNIILIKSKFQINDKVKCACVLSIAKLHDTITEQLIPSAISMTLDDENFMLEALLEAKKAFAQDEVPVGAVLVYEGKIIARGHNLVEAGRNAAAHAEMICLQEGAKILGNWRLLECNLYCTLEPCPMCAGAMALFRIKRLVYGAPDLRHGAHGSVFNVLNMPHPIHQVEVEGGCLAEEAKGLMKEFFMIRRKSGTVV